jgi:hypothetical protein
MLQSAEKYVYHYTSAQTLTDHILPTRRLRFSRFENVNDPRESRKWAFNFIKYSSALDARVEEISEGFNHHLKRDWRIGCFVSDTDGAVVSQEREGNGQNVINALYERGHSRPAMWWHYGDKHRGACLVFDKVALDAAVRAAPNALHPILCGRVEYHNPSPLASFLGSNLGLDIDCVSLLQFGVDEAAKRHLGRHARMLLFTKLRDWEPEREFRWAVSVDSEEDHFIEFAGSLVGIIIGDQFPEKRRRSVGEFAGTNNVEIGYMTWQNGVPQPKPSHANVIDTIELR